MRSTLGFRSLLLVLTSLCGVVAPSDARACGGCFNPPTPTGSPTPVTGHRMAVALSPRGTTLWDQIQYAGSPEDFVWVLPVMGAPMVELADNGFFEALTAETQITMTAPAPPRAFCPSAGIGFGCASSRAAPASADAGAGGVEVFFEGVVGPYATATIGSTDPDALVTWLLDNGYQVPDSIRPTIDAYVAMGANFAVLRLAPGEGVDRMQPVRITSPGLSLTFPLRMVAAGVQTTVALELFVFAESRTEAANYENAEVDRNAIVYDWAAGTFSYDDEFENALFSATSGTAWVTEFAGLADTAGLAAFTSVDDDGTVHRAATDVAVVTAALDLPYLTRMRTRLPPSELDRDLVLQASEGFDLGRDIRVTRELNRAADRDCSGSCSAASEPHDEDVVVASLVGLPLLGLVRRARRHAGRTRRPA